MADPAPYPYSDIERRELLPFLPADAALILDVGCGMGGFSRVAKAKASELVAWGIEPNPSAAAHAARTLDRVVTGNFPDDMPADSPRFDTIFFNDVLEHMVDPWAALIAAKPFIADGGRVVASLPNLRHYTVLNSLIRRADFTYTDSGILDRTHLRFFTRSTMVEMFTSTGYDVTSCSPIGVAGPRKASLLARLPWMSRDILALQFVIVATPCTQTTDTGS
jgi:2-polyprenyl-3-methyl-5-hydroxy-6-metoxy-1,4-benzoquinol methylase